MDRGAALGRAKRALEEVGLGARLEHQPGEMSGGERQRCAFARAMVTGPACVLADEPTGNLDSRNGAEVLRLLDEVRRERGVTLLLATHSRAAAARADRVATMRDGRVISE